MLICLAVPVGLGVSEPPAQAAYPGDNGRLACEGMRNPDTTLSAINRTEIYTINPDGTGESVLTNNAVRDGDPGFSPDGAFITFETFRAGGFSEVFKVDAAGFGATALTTNGVGEDRSTHWSPDGTKIALHTSRDPVSAGNDPFEIYVMNADGTSPVRLTNNLDKDTFPAWSPDGTRIAFASDRTGDFEIWTMDPNGANLTQVTNSTGEDAHPTWSPDGTQLAFHSRRDGPTNLEIYRSNANGSAPVRLTNSTALEFFPIWSPDGKRIAFVGDPDQATNYDIHHVNAIDGSGRVRVTQAAGFDSRCDWLSAQTLSVSKAGAGSGSVVSSAPGIDCGTDCTEPYARSARVTLVADAESASKFDGFSGGGCSGSSIVCTVSLSESRSVTATFSLRPVATPTPTPTPTVTVTVTPGPVITPRVTGTLTAAAAPRRDSRRPFRFTISGRLGVRAGVKAADACKGQVTIRIKAGPKTISTTRPKLTPACRYTRTVVFKSAARFGRRSSLSALAKFEGNAAVLPVSAKRLSLRVR